MDFNLVDESGMTPAELTTLRYAVLRYLVPLKPWGFGDCQVTIGAGDGVPVCITKRNRKIGAAGYHTVENGKPAIYVLPATEKFGYFASGRPAKLASPAKKIGAFTLPARPAVPATPDTMRSGQLATICHEIAEVLGDPVIQTLANPDSLGHPYLRELADPVHGQYFMEVIGGVNCIFPNTVLPNWYELGSKAPYDVMGWCTAPFMKSPRGYAFWKDKLGNFIKV